MISFCTSLFLLSACASAAAAASSSDFVLKGDPCSKYDSCLSKSLVRTCSCDVGSCRDYGTCCHDLKTTTAAADGSSAAFRCYDRRSTTPVFVKRWCPEDFRGHVGDVAACLEEDEDVSDVKNNLLVTSHKTKVTYWNKHCAACNREVAEDLEYWNIEVHCPQREGLVDRRLIRKNLTFDDDSSQWGLEIEGEFLPCVVRYSPPSYIDEVKHCTPNLIAACPPDYSDRDVAAKCTSYYAERKRKGSNVHYQNAHCALCNGVDVRELECPGMSAPEDDLVDDADFGITEVFGQHDWLNGRRTYQCGRGYAYDPLSVRCRKDGSLTQSVAVVQEAVPDSSAAVRKELLVAVLAAVSFVFLSS